MKYDIYLSGPMTGYPEFNYPAFNAAAKLLRDYNVSVFNPAENFDGDQTRQRSAYMRVDLEAVMQSKTLVALEGWETSKGARLEIMVAQELDIAVVTLDDMLKMLRETTSVTP